MAPFFALFSLLAFALAASVLASPHIPRHVHNLAHRAPVPVDVPRRALNKRCVPRPSNSTSAYPTSTPPPANVAPSPSIYPTSALASTPSSSASTYVPQTPSQDPSPSATSAPTTTSTPPPEPTTTSTPPPEPTTTSTPPPEPTTTSTPPPSTPTSTPPPAQTSSSSSNSGEPSYLSGTQSGDGTYFEVGLGACGVTSNDSQYVVAVSQYLFDSYPQYNGNPNDNPVCNKKITASYQGKSVTVTVVDRCTGCSETSLDFSPSAFSQLADKSLGRIQITWVWS